MTNPESLAKLLLTPQPKMLPKADVLQLAGTRSSEDWSASIGMKIYREKSALVDDLKTIAEKNDCCVFVAHDNRGFSFATEKSLKPPPTTVAYEIRDAASMQTFVGSLAKRPSGTGNERAVVFFDTPESHVQASMRNLSAGRKGEPTLIQLADALGTSKVGVPESRVNAISTKDLKGRTSILRSLAERIETKGKEFIERFTTSQSKQVWVKAEISVLHPKETAKFVEGLNWNLAENGVPSAVVVKFEGTSARPASLDIGVVVGLTEGKQQVAQTTLRATAEKNLSIATLKQASLAEYAASIRNDLQQMTSLKIRRLSIVVNEGETTTLLTLHFTDRSKQNAHRLGEPS